MMMAMVQLFGSLKHAWTLIRDDDDNNNNNNNNNNDDDDDDDDGPVIRHLETNMSF